MGEFFVSVSKFDWKKIYVRKKNSVITLCQKYCFCRIFFISLRFKAKINILTTKKTIDPPPFKLNGCSLSWNINKLSHLYVIATQIILTSAILINVILFYTLGLPHQQINPLKTVSMAYGTDKTMVTWCLEIDHNYLFFWDWQDLALYSLFSHNIPKCFCLLQTFMFDVSMNMFQKHLILARMYCNYMYMKCIYIPRKLLKGFKRSPCLALWSIMTFVKAKEQDKVQPFYMKVCLQSIII